MRLQKQEIHTILQVARNIYGEKVKVYLFGSRLDNTKRGGDIDLLIRTDEEKKGVLARIRMIAQLKFLLGDQKIDIIGDHEDSIVAQEALRKGVLLVWQDAMGAKIFRYILEYLDEVTSLPMRDILNRLEKYKFLPDANEWIYIRELRNEIAHDYPLMENDVVHILNELFTKVNTMYGIYDKLKAAYF